MPQNHPIAHNGPERAPALVWAIVIALVALAYGVAFWPALRAYHWGGVL